MATDTDREIDTQMLLCCVMFILVLTCEILTDCTKQDGEDFYIWILTECTKQDGEDFYISILTDCTKQDGEDFTCTAPL